MRACKMTRMTSGLIALALAVTVIVYAAIAYLRADPPRQWFRDEPTTDAEREILRQYWPKHFSDRAPKGFSTGFTQDHAGTVVSLTERRRKP